ncbi:hypothetical protein PAMP_022978 [Pampus punctatissimus]
MAVELLQRRGMRVLFYLDNLVFLARSREEASLQTTKLEGTKQNDSSALAAEGRGTDGSSPLCHASQCCDSSLCHAAAGHYVSKLRRDSSGSPPPEMAVRVVHLSGHQSCASAEMNVCIWFSPLEKIFMSPQGDEEHIYHRWWGAVLTYLFT